MGALCVTLITTMYYYSGLMVAVGVVVVGRLQWFDYLPQSLSDFDIPRILFSI
jgi:hypothetical protein